MHKIMIAGGGTGGHIYPGLAVYQALRSGGKKPKVMFVGTSCGIDGDVFSRAEVPYILLPGKGLRGGSILNSFKAVIAFLAALVRGIIEVLKFKPDIVLGTGGYASAAVVVAAVLCRRSRVLQEQNSIPGFVNRFLSRFAHLVLLSFEESRSYLPKRVVCAVVGNPIRYFPAGVDERLEAQKRLDIRGDLPTVLIMGGSRGAKSLSVYGVEAARMVIKKMLAQFIIITGDNNFASVQERIGDEKDLIRVFPFVHQMDAAYAVADVAVARAGASSVFELAAFGIPTIFVPYPYAADDHQRQNIAGLARIGAAETLDDDKLSGGVLAQKILDLLKDDSARKIMADKLVHWAKPDAAQKSAQIISALIKKNAGSRIKTVCLTSAD